MAAGAEEVKFSLRVMINKEKTKVLFAEIDSDFADVLLSFLTLPLGTIVRLLEKHYGDKAPVLGSLRTLYKGLVDLDNVHFWTEAGKLMLLNPRSCFQDECSKLKLNIDDTEPIKYFTCENCGGGRISLYHGNARCCCGRSILKLFMSTSNVEANPGDGGVFTRRYNFLVADDLQMAPNLTGSILETLSNLGISDTCGAEIRTVVVGFNEVMDLLKASLLSQTPLTDLILKKMDSSTAECTSVVLHTMLQQTAASNATKMIAKAMIQKSTNKLLFAQTGSDFVDFLFSLLTIPLGAVVRLLGGNDISLWSVGNLHRSIACFDGDQFLKTPDIKTKLLNPELPPMYLSKNQIFALTEKRPSLPTFGTFEDLKGKDNSYVKGPRMFKVTDDLTVTPLCMISSISILNGLEIPLTDVEERAIEIGMEEGLRILEASLTSTTALSYALNPMLRKKAKQEH